MNAVPTGTSPMVHKLIELRGTTFEKLFTAKRFNVIESWQKITRELSNYLLLIGETKRPTCNQVKKKWFNIVQMYKKLKDPPTGRGTEDGEETASNWAYFEEMHNIMCSKDVINPYLISSINQNANKSTHSFINAPTAICPSIVEDTSDTGQSELETFLEDDYFCHEDVVNEEILNLLPDAKIIDITLTTPTSSTNMSEASTETPTVFTSPGFLIESDIEDPLEIDEESSSSQSNTFFGAYAENPSYIHQNTYRKRRDILGNNFSIEQATSFVPAPDEVSMPTTPKTPYNRKKSRDLSFTNETDSTSSSSNAVFLEPSTSKSAYTREAKKQKKKKTPSDVKADYRKQRD